MFELKIVAETALELQHKVLALAAIMGDNTEVMTNKAFDVEFPQGSFEDEKDDVLKSSVEKEIYAEEKPAPKKRARKVKSEAPKAEVVLTPMPLAPEAVAPATPDFEDAEEEKSAISISDIRNAAANVVPDPVADAEIAVSKEAAMEALTKLNGAKGINVAREVLAKFEASRFSELKEENYAPFIAACKAA